MAYTPTNWQARAGTGLNRFVDQNGNTLILTSSPTEVITPGTPFTADNMNHIETGVADAHTAIAALGTDVNAKAVGAMLYTYKNNGGAL